MLHLRTGEGRRCAALRWAESIPAQAGLRRCLGAAAPASEHGANNPAGIWDEAERV